MMTFEILADPVPLARPRFSKNGRAYLPTRSRDYRQVIQNAIKAQLSSDFFPFEGEIVCRLKFYRKFKPSSRRFGDLDNHVKAVMDAAQGILFADDSQVVSTVADKIQSDRPRTEFSIKIKQ